MSRLTDDQIMDAMLSANAQPHQVSRLDDVAQMVAQMEKNITEKIDMANKQLVDQMQTQINNVPKQAQDEPKENNINGGNTNEDYSGSGEHGEEE